MESSPLLDKGIRIRSFRELDTERIQEIFLQAIVYSQNSPANTVLKYQSKKPLTFVLYIVFALGVVLLSYPAPTRIVGALLVITTLGLFFTWRQILWSKFEIHSQEVVRTDLANIRNNYGKSPSGFWVAEIVDGSPAGKIVGCVGLDSISSQDPGTAELRRMVVDPTYQKHGVGRLLMTALVDHAKASGLSTITLSTSMYQLGAMHMYESFGFIKDKQQEWFTIKFIFTVDNAYMQFFTLNLPSEKW